MEATVTYKKKIIDLKEDTFKALSVMAARHKPLRHRCAMPPPLSRGGFGIPESLPSSPEAPLLGELSAKQTERLYRAEPLFVNASFYWKGRNLSWLIIRSILT